MVVVAALRVISAFVIQLFRTKSGLPRPAQSTYALPDVHAGQHHAALSSRENRDGEFT